MVSASSAYHDAMRFVLACFAVSSLLLAGASSTGCGSSGAHGSPAIDASVDGESRVEGSAGDAPTSDGASPLDAGDAPPQADAAASPCATGGDRRLSPDEPFPASLLIQNGGRVYDVKSPPTSAQHAAVGDGTTDDTAALQDAWDYLKDAYVDAGANQATSYDDANFWIYLPSGTYLVRDTIIYRGGTLETDPGHYVWNEVVHVRFYGESRATTTIRLADAAAGFGDVTKPKIVLAMQHPDTVFNNIVGENSVRNLTVDVGHGNPGAVGLMFQGANSTSMRNVSLVSEDGQGAYGLWFSIGSVQGFYRDVSVTGFDYGIYVTANGEMDPSLEHVTLSGQRRSAVGVVGGGLSLRQVCSDQRVTGAQGVVLDKTGGQVVVLDSTFLGGAPGDGGADGSALEMTATTEQSMFVRNVTTSGYARAVVRASATAVAGPAVTEWVALPTVTMFDGGVAHSLGLPVQDAPIVPWYDPATQWADVDTFGAAGDGTTDDTKAVQAAMASGKPVVVFPKARYKLSASITIPASVSRIDEMSGDFTGENAFVVSDVGTGPLLVEHVAGYASFTLGAPRTVVLGEYSGSFLDLQSAPAQVFLENCDNIGANAAFAPANQTTWARSIDTEEVSGSDFIVSGGTAWIFDYKTENKACTSLRAENGATVEVYNGYVNTTVAPGATPMIVNDHSRVSLVGFTNLSGQEWTTSLEEVRDAGTQTVPRTALPSRDSSNVFIPLYSGDAR
jgi:hypothetical protein